MQQVSWGKTAQGSTCFLLPVMDKSGPLQVRLQVREWLLSLLAIAISPVRTLLGILICTCDTGLIYCGVIACCVCTVFQSTHKWCHSTQSATVNTSSTVLSLTLNVLNHWSNLIPHPAFLDNLSFPSLTSSAQRAFPLWKASPFCVYLALSN